MKNHLIIVMLLLPLCGCLSRTTITGLGVAGSDLASHTKVYVDQVNGRQRAEDIQLQIFGISAKVQYDQDIWRALYDNPEVYFCNKSDARHVKMDCFCARGERRSDWLGLAWLCTLGIVPAVSERDSSVSVIFDSGNAFTVRMRVRESVSWFGWYSPRGDTEPIGGGLDSMDVQRQETSFALGRVAEILQ